jgi:magnesium-transporting ATPase (P-type)
VPDTCIFDEFAITGRSEKISYQSGCDWTDPVVHAGALCVQGGCVGRVVATGTSTTIGKMILNRKWPP